MDPIFALLRLVAAAVATLASMGVAWYAITFCRRPYNTFRGKRCVIVGAANGIGKQVAIALSRGGGGGRRLAGHLILIDICDMSGLEQELRGGAAMPSSALQITCIRCDVSDLDQVRERISLDDGTAVDLLVLCAGVVTGKPLLDLECEEFDRTVRTNLSSHFYLVKMVMRRRPRRVGEGQRRRKLSIVTVSSLMGLIGGARLVDYCASKFALVGMFEALRMEHYDDDDSVRFSVVCPWVVDTGLFAGIFQQPSLSYIPRMFPFLTPQKVAEEVLRSAELGRAVSIVPLWFTPLAWGVRLLPDFVYFPVLGALGGRTGMDSFMGGST